MADDLTDDPRIRQQPTVPTLSVGIEGATAFTPEPGAEAFLPDELGREEALALQSGLEVKARSQWSYARRRFFRHKLAMISLVVLIIVLGAGIFAKWVAPYRYDELDLLNAASPPTLEGNHFFGTDVLGRDYFSRVIYGIQTSEKVAFFVAIISTLIGTVVGSIAGYFGGFFDNLLMRFTDLVLTIPGLAVLLTAAALLGWKDPLAVGLILALLFWTPLARIVRGQFLSLREKEYVEAAKAAGSGDFRIMFRHILPNALGPIIVFATLTVGLAILVEATLSFLGFGIQPPTPALGKLIGDAQNTSSDLWWLVTFPGLTIVLIVLCINFIGDGLRDALDPTQRRTRT
jgi:peptide/nickel transport system permease protein